MKKLIIILILLQLILIGLALSGRKFTININRQKVSMTMQEIVNECEKLSAVATNDQWSYDQCKKNLEHPYDAKILKI